MLFLLEKEMIENTNAPTGHKPMWFCFCGGSVFIILYYRIIISEQLF